MYSHCNDVLSFAILKSFLVGRRLCARAWDLARACITHRDGRWRRIGSRVVKTVHSKARDDGARLGKVSMFWFFLKCRRGWRSPYFCADKIKDEHPSAPCPRGSAEGVQRQLTWTMRGRSFSSQYDLAESMSILSSSSSCPKRRKGEKAKSAMEVLI